jgi:hypothetical protein
MKTSLNDKIAALAFDPAAPEGEAIAAFLKLRARKVKPDEIEKHTQAETPKNAGSNEVTVRVGKDNVLKLVSLIQSSFGVYSEKAIIKIGNEFQGKWAILVSCDQCSYDATKRVVSHAVDSMNYNGKRFYKWDTETKKYPYDDMDDLNFDRGMYDELLKYWKKKYGI